MMARMLTYVLCCSGLCVAVGGCRSTCQPNQSCAPPCQSAYGGCDPQRVYVRPAPTGCQPGPSGYCQPAPPGFQQPGATAYPSAPSGSYYQIRPSDNYQAPPGIPPGAPCPNPPERTIQQQSLASPAAAAEEPRWHGAGGPNVRLLDPSPLSTDSGKAEVRASPPEPAPAPPRNDIEDRQSISPLPIGIAHFMEIKSDRIAAGFRPHPTDGIPWLQGKGYKTVLHLRQPGTSDANDRRLIEKHGLKYVSLEVAPELLTRDLVDQLTAITADDGSLPLFVYDKDGGSTSVLFYLYFRLHENLPEERAKNLATQLGLKDEGSSEGQAWWTAIHKILP